MVGGSTHRVVRGEREQGAARAGSETGWMAELEGLRKALTEAEFESARRHLLAG
jgi:hypothetical protein